MQVWHFQKPISTTLRLKRDENIWRNILNISKHCTHSILKRMFQAKYRGRLPFTDFSQRPTPFSVLNIARIANPATPRGRGGALQEFFRKSQGFKGTHRGSRGSRGTSRGSPVVKGTHRGVQGGMYGVPDRVKKNVLGVQRRQRGHQGVPILRESKGLSRGPRRSMQGS